MSATAVRFSRSNLPAPHNAGRQQEALAAAGTSRITCNTVARLRFPPRIANARDVRSTAIASFGGNAPMELRRLIDAALRTGCRFGELANLRCWDLVTTTRNLDLPPAMRSPGRTVVLSDAGWQFLESHRTGRTGDDWLVRRAEGRQWTRSATSGNSTLRHSATHEPGEKVSTRCGTPVPAGSPRRIARCNQTLQPPHPASLSGFNFPS